MRNAKRGFTIIEALVAVALTAIGVVAVLSSLGALTYAQARAFEKERMQRLAIEKYDELILTGEYQTTTSGNFEDRNEDRYSWSVETETTGTENLIALTVRVSHSERNSEEAISGIVFERPQVTTAGGIP